MPKISIIVPVYNVEKYLPRCLDSIIGQTFKDWECLVIDDGSTDTSGTICDEYAIEDDRIKVFHRNNSGVSSSRNYGLDMANGEYIIFIDSDDYWIDSDSLDNLISQIRDNDVVRGEYIKVYDSGEIIEPIRNKKALDSNRISSYDMITKGIAGEYFSFLFLFRKSAINDIRFDETLSFREDMDFLLKIFSAPLKCIYTSKCFYAYVDRMTSASNTHIIENIRCSLYLSNTYLTKKSLPEELISIYTRMSMRLYLWSISAFSLISKKNPQWLNLQNSIKDTRSSVVRNVSWHDCSLIYLILVYVPSECACYLYKLKHYLIHYYRSTARTYFAKAHKY